MALDKAVVRDIELRCALSQAGRHITKNKPTRMISGCVISSAKRNTNGDSFIARGLTDIGQKIPLLIDHDTNHVLGVVTRAWAAGDRVEFEAEIMNSDVVEYAESAWLDIWLQNHVAVSIGPKVFGAAARDGVYPIFGIEEISLVGTAADTGARILRCWERENVVNLQRKSSIHVHWECPA